MVNRNEHWNGAVIGGTLLRDFVGNAMTNPAGVVDKIQEGTIVPDINGALPFPCTVSSPSGAFVE